MEAYTFEKNQIYFWNNLFVRHYPVVAMEILMSFEEFSEYVLNSSSPHMSEFMR